MGPDPDRTLLPPSEEQTMAAPGGTLDALGAAVEASSTEDTVCATQAPSERPTQQIAPRIGRFSLFRELGRGAMGVVYAGYDDELDRKVAIKLLHKRDSEDARLRLVREAQGLARLSHPNVVQVYEIGDHEDSTFLAMEFVDGSTLKQWMAAGPRTEREIIAVFLSAGRGLAAAHDKGLVHRDFKPDNVMIDTDGRVRVMDFGLVHEGGEGEAVDMERLSRPGRVTELNTDMTATGALMGTPAYMAPEQYVGLDTDGRTDQFGFCVALWEALYGERPFTGATLAELFTNVTNGHRREPPKASEVPGWLRKVVERGLETDADARWPSMHALLAALATDPTRRRRGLVAAIVGLALLVAVVVGIGEQRRRSERAEREAWVATCTRAGQAVDGVWNRATNDAIAASFARLELSYAADTWTRTSARIDGYTARWTELRTTACVETHVEHHRDPAEFTRVEACLDERLAGLDSLLDILRDTDAELVKVAVSSAANLPRLEPCVDPRRLDQLVSAPDSIAAEVARLRTELGRARALQATGRYLAGLDRVRALRTEAEVLGWAPLMAEIEHDVGVLEAALDHEQAADTLRRAYFMAGEAGHDLVALAAAGDLAGYWGVNESQHEAGLLWADHADMFIIRLGLEGSLEKAEVLYERGDIQRDAGQFEQARETLERSLALREQLLGPDDPHVASALDRLGIVARNLGDFDGAIAYLERALSIHESARGPDSPSTIAVGFSLANAHWARGDLDQAQAGYQRALSAWRETLGPAHPRVALAHNALGNCHFGRGEFDAALAEYERALAVFEAAPGANQRDMALALMNIGSVHYERHELDASLDMTRRALELYEGLYGPEHPMVAMTLGNLGAILVEQGRLDDAEPPLLRSLELYESIHGPDHIDLAQARDKLARLRLDQGRADEAVELFAAALEIAERHAVGELDLADLRFGLAQALAASGDTARVDALVEQALAGATAAGRDDRASEIRAWRQDH